MNSSSESRIPSPLAARPAGKIVKSRHERIFVAKSVETHRHGVQSRPQERLEPPRVEGQSVGHQAPRIFAAVEFQTDSLQIAAYEHLTAREDHQHAVGIDVGRDLRIEHPEEIFGGHIGVQGFGTAIAAAMAACEVAAQRAFPKERTQFVPPDVLGMEP